ncbi:DUF7507 domain-containing protein, partial [Planktosalinus lacus]|uniref:DUF7507 domain-containing protein n=1 Tax=Planktosalinus lacus TaxID=1526573 RepID=UPI001666DC13
WVYDETGTSPNCSDEISFVVTINDTPVVDDPNDVSVCFSYVLPELINGNYFTGPEGTGTQLNEGFEITSTTTLYVYSETGTTPNCFAENSFVVTINECSIALVKEAQLNNSGDCTSVGDTIDYTFSVYNTGDVPISNVNISDPLFEAPNPVISITYDSGDTNNDGLLDPNEVWIYSTTYTITQNNINSGEVINQATVNGFANGNVPLTDLSGLSINDDLETITELCQDASIAIVKESEIDSGDCTQVGDVITYTFTVTNQGNVTLSDVVMTDPLAGLSAITFVGGDTNTDGNLDIDEVWTYTATYAVTQEDIDTGEVENQATAVAEAPNGDEVNDLSGSSIETDDATINELCQDASIAIVKESEIDSGDCTQVGDVITYTFTVTNQGNVTLSDVVVTDPLVGLSAITFVGGDTNTDGNLDIDEVWTYTATYAVTQEDIDAGEVENQATAVAEAPNGDEVNDLSGSSIETDDATITELCQDAAIAIVKESEIDSGDCTQVGDVITYTFTVTNQGNVTLSDVVVTDPLAGLSAITFVGGDTNTDGNLDIDEVWTYTATYAVTQEDIDTGEVENQATAVAEAPNGDEVNDLSGSSIETDDPTVTELCQDAAIALVKTGVFNGEGDCAAIGDTITYTFEVSNQGYVTISDVNVSDPLFEAPNPVVDIQFVDGDVNNNGLLEVDEVWTYTATYTIIQEDIDAGQVVNQAFVEGLDPEGMLVTDISGTAIDNDTPTLVELCQEMSIALEKAGIFDDNNGDESAQVGETVSYSFTVYNTGSVTLYNITIDDPLVQVEGGPIASLAPGESDSTTFTAVYTVTQTDLDNGEVVNQATVFAEDIESNMIEDLSDDPSDLTDIDINGNGNPDDPTIVILPQVAGEAFEIFNGVTPNNDGLNDFFRIEGIEDYTNNNVQIFNRWGVLVFERDNYNNAENAFRGRSEGRVTVKEDDELPTGTYFYIIRFIGDNNPGQSSYSGYLYLNR